MRENFLMQKNFLFKIVCPGIFSFGFVPKLSSSRQLRYQVSVVNFTEFDIVDAPVDYIVNASIVTASEAAEKSLDIQGDPRTFFSQLVFKQCPRGPGRPNRKIERVLQTQKLLKELLRIIMMMK